MAGRNCHNGGRFLSFARPQPATIHHPRARASSDDRSDERRRRRRRRPPSPPHTHIMAMASPPPTPSVLPNKGGLISTLNPNDVLSGRGKHVNSHPGNIRFLTRIVPEFLEEYSHPTTTRTEKVHVVARLVNEIRLRSNPPGRFLTGCKDNPGQYVEIGDELAWKST